MSTPMIRPHQVDTLPFLDAQQKVTYKHGLANLWSQYESSAEGTQAKNDAKAKLIAASAKIMQQISQGQRNRPGPAAAQQRPAQNGQPGGQQQPGHQNQNTQAAPQTQAQTQQSQGQPQPSGDHQDAALKQRISSEVNQVIVYPSPETTTQQQFEQYKQNFKTQLGTYKLKAEKAKENQTTLQRHIQQLRQQGQETSSTEIAQKVGQLKSIIETCTRSINNLMEANERNKAAIQARKNGQVNRQASANGDQSGPPRPPTQPGAQNAQDASMAASSPAPQQTPGMAPNNQARPQQAQSSANAAQPPRPSSQQAMAQQAQRPPINPAAAQQYGSQYPNAAGMAQNANAQQRPHALSQQGAIARAQEQNFQQQSNNPQQPAQQIQPPQPGPNGFNQVPHASTPTSATPSQAQGGMSQKLPIPKTLPPGAQIQTPVNGPPARPTMGHSGMMNVPGVQKVPPFTLEGEGDHVLSKRKLDELVRQVTGSTDPADGLTPEVEEAVLSLTDDFVDNVITKACQLAKLRQGQTLEIRDIQLVLERNYGIRVPGYSLDETRVARKFQPGAGWIAKVQAVQAGKVMGGNRDA